MAILVPPLPKHHRLTSVSYVAAAAPVAVIVTDTAAAVIGECCSSASKMMISFLCFALTVSSMTVLWAKVTDR